MKSAVSSILINEAWKKQQHVSLLHYNLYCEESKTQKHQDMARTMFLLYQTHMSRFKKRLALSNLNICS